MSIYQITKDLGKKALLVSGLVAALSGCEQKPGKTNVLADVNGDGIEDRVEYKRDPSGFGFESHNIYVALGSGNGSFGKSRKVLFLDHKPYELIVKYVDNDGYLDILVVMQDIDKASPFDSWERLFARGRGNGDFDKFTKLGKDNWKLRRN